METITSRENAKIKYACRLREEEKLRTADGLFFAEGPKLCLELARGCTLQTLYATEKALAHTPELEAFAGKTVLVTEPVAQKLSGTKTSQDVFGVFEHPGWQAADILAKGTKVDGIYDKDPLKYSDAKKYEEVSYEEAIVKNLKVMDATALSLCKENNMPIIVFDALSEGNMLKLVKGEKIGTIVK